MAIMTFFGLALSRPTSSKSKSKREGSAIPKDVKKRDILFCMVVYLKRPTMSLMVMAIAKMKSRANPTAETVFLILSLIFQGVYSRGVSLVRASPAGRLSEVGLESAVALARA